MNPQRSTPAARRNVGTTSVAVIADIHGNLPALRSVIREVRQLGLDAIVCCGDIASGPLPVETIEYVQHLDIPFRSVRGNADRGALEAFDSARDGVPADDSWTGQTIRREQRDFLAALPLTLEMEVGGLGRALFCHGSPRADDEIVLEITPASRLEPMLASVSVPLVVCGHTHMQFDRAAGRHRLINPGSVGWPYGAPGAYWAILGTHVELRRTEYDIAQAVDEILRSSSWPSASAFCDALTSPPTRETALRFFTSSAPPDSRHT